MQYDRLRRRLMVLAQQDPENYHTHADVRFFRQIRDSMDVALADPQKRQYRLGNALGEGRGDWRRIKQGMPERHRLFFRFTSQDHKVIFAWLSDERSLRREGDHNDVYRVFQRMLTGGSVPGTLAALLSAAKEYKKSRNEDC